MPAALLPELRRAFCGKESSEGTAKVRAVQISCVAPYVGLIRLVTQHDGPGIAKSGWIQGKEARAGQFFQLAAWINLDLQKGYEGTANRRGRVHPCHKRSQMDRLQRLRYGSLRVIRRYRMEKPYLGG
jgi:hypothetical protein